MNREGPRGTKSAFRCDSVAPGGRPGTTRTRRASAEGVFGCAIVLLLIGAASAAAAPSVTVPVATGKFGQVIELQGKGFPAASTGVIDIGGVRATRVKTNRLGRFTARFRLPAIEPGPRRLVAAVRAPGTTTFRRASSIFTVRPGMFRVDHVVWIVMENKNYEHVIGAPAAPYLTQLSRAYGNATQMSAEIHPSLRNYIAMTSGTMQNALADSGPPTAHPLNIDSIFGQLKGNWRALQDNMPTNCALANSGTYAVRHNPATYYTPIAAECATRNVPLADPPDLSARFTFITPDLCNGTHDCPVATGDAWLRQFIPKIVRTPQYQAGRTVVFLTWDESDGTPENHIATIVIAPTSHRRTSNQPFNHYSMLRTTEELLGLPFLGFAATAPSMRAAFRL